MGHLHSGGFLTFWKKLPPSRRRAALAELSRLDAFIVLSEQWRGDVAAEVGVPRRLLQVVNNPIDARFENAALQLPVDDRPAAILAMGELRRDKGVLDLIAACGVLRQRGVTFPLCLAGPEREAGILAEIRRLVARHGLGDCVDLPGRIGADAKLRVFRETGVSILPSYYENFPLVLIEAAAAGHAIVPTPVGAVPELFGDGISALIVEPRHVVQIAAALQQLVIDPAERKRAALGARRIFQQRLARPVILHSLQEDYRKALASR